MLNLPRWLVIILSVCTFIVLFLLLGGAGYLGGYWAGQSDEREAQDWDDTHMVFEKNEDGSLTIEHGDEELTLFKRELLPAESRPIRERTRQREERQLERTSSEPHGEPHCSGTYHRRGCEHSSSREGRRQRFSDLPRE